jgi:hypothetical protein
MKEMNSSPCGSGVLQPISAHAIADIHENPFARAKIAVKEELNCRWNKVV